MMNKEITLNLFQGIFLWLEDDVCYHKTYEILNLNFFY